MGQGSESVIAEAKRQRDRCRDGWSKGLSMTETERQEAIPKIMGELRVNKHTGESRPGLGSTVYGEQGEGIIPRRLEMWDKDLCYELKHDGDPELPTKLKDHIFDMYINCIDKNSSLAPWQRHLAFNMIPKAFGGPQGEYLSE